MKIKKQRKRSALQACLSDERQLVKLLKETNFTTYITNNTVRSGWEMVLKKLKGRRERASNSEIGEVMRFWKINQVRLTEKLQEVSCVSLFTNY